MIRRLRAPAILLLVGVVALLDQTGVVDHFWRWFFPLLLILLGVIMLAERAALATEGGFPATFYPGASCPGTPDPRTATGIPPYPGQPMAQVPTEPRDSKNESEGGLS
jgi:hypothetical protein